MVSSTVTSRKVLGTAESHGGNYWTHTCNNVHTIVTQINSWFLYTQPCSLPAKLCHSITPFPSLCWPIVHFPHHFPSYSILVPCQSQALNNPCGSLHAVQPFSNPTTISSTTPYQTHSIPSLLLPLISEWLTFGTGPSIWVELDASGTGASVLRNCGPLIGKT